MRRAKACSASAACRAPSPLPGDDDLAALALTVDAHAIVSEGLLEQLKVRMRRAANVAQHGSGLATGTVMRLARADFGFTLTRAPLLLPQRAAPSGLSLLPRRSRFRHAARQMRAAIDVDRLHIGRIAQRLAFARPCARTAHDLAAYRCVVEGLRLLAEER
jgi:hypothetical protein